MPFCLTGNECPISENTLIFMVSVSKTDSHDLIKALRVYLICFISTTLISSISAGSCFGIDLIRRVKLPSSCGLCSGSARSTSLLLRNIHEFMNCFILFEISVLRVIIILPQEAEMRRTFADIFKATETIVHFPK